MAQRVVNPARPSPIPKKRGVAGFFFELYRNKLLYIMMLPACALLFAFNYMPLFGLSLVFKDFDYGKGIFASPFANPWYNNFIFLFKPTSGITRALTNTLIMNVYFLVYSTMFAVLLAILLNEITHRKTKRVLQSFTLLPYFISVIVISVFIYQLLNTDTGMINGFLKSINIKPVRWYDTPRYWRTIMTVIFIWKNAGYTSVIYLATITGIDSTLFEAAEIDGAGRFNKIIYITFPLLVPTMLTLSLLAVGRIMSSDFGFFYAITNDSPRLFKAVDVLDTLIYRNLRKQGDFTMAGAASFIQAVMSAVILVITNHFARRFDSNAALF